MRCLLPIPVEIEAMVVNLRRRPRRANHKGAYKFAKDNIRAAIEPLQGGRLRASPGATCPNAIQLQALTRRHHYIEYTCFHQVLQHEASNFVIAFPEQYPYFRYRILTRNCATSYSRAAEARTGGRTDNLCAERSDRK